jgi:hypothetical protein
VGLSAAWKNEIEAKLTPIFANHFRTLTEFCEYDEGAEAKALKGIEAVTFNLLKRRLAVIAKLAMQELHFQRLTHRTFTVTPLIAIAFLVFAWAANPPKVLDVPTMEKPLQVDAADRPLLGKIFPGAAACSGPTLHVIVLGEWPSGVQDVVTVPSQGCPPVRLRLDHGRISAAK